jgi:multidrug efflux pump subunit AcrB
MPRADGSKIRTPMAIAIIGGLVLSTVLSLVVVPAFYVVAEKVGWRTRKKGRGGRPCPA